MLSSVSPEAFVAVAKFRFPYDTADSFRKEIKSFYFLPSGETVRAGKRTYFTPPMPV